MSRTAGLVILFGNLNLYAVTETPFYFFLAILGLWIIILGEDS